MKFLRIWDPADGEFYFLKHKKEGKSMTKDYPYDCLSSVCPQ